MIILRLEIRGGRWKSPSNSKDRSKDDTHKIKEKILKEIGKHIFEKDVGKNPDLDIDPVTEKIILKGTAEKYSKEIFETEIDADKYFVKCYLATKYPRYLDMVAKHHKIGNYYIIHADINMVSLLLDHIFTQENHQEYFIDIVI